MSLSILGGQLKGLKLKSPSEQITRPTSVMLRRKLFDWKQNWQDFIFIDLFAGSGIVGFEAISRGAMSLHCIENNSKSFETLKLNQNLANKRVSEININLYFLKSIDFLKNVFPKLIKLSPDIFFYIDPPYAKTALYQEVFSELKTIGFEGLVAVESDKLTGLGQDEINRQFHSVIKIFHHGDHFIIIGKFS